MSAVDYSSQYSWDNIASDYEDYLQQIINDTKGNLDIHAQAPKKKFGLLGK
jgi:predicted RNA-binding protein Jag